MQGIDQDAGVGLPALCDEPVGRLQGRYAEVAHKLDRHAQAQPLALPAQRCEVRQHPFRRNSRRHQRDHVACA
jgi:hypothetical protein